MNISRSASARSLTAALLALLLAACSSGNDLTLDPLGSAFPSAEAPADATKNPPSTEQPTTPSPPDTGTTQPPSPSPSPTPSPTPPPPDGSTGTVVKANYGHYFATRYSDTGEDVAMLCEQPGVTGVVWRRTWREVEVEPGVYDFGSFDGALDAIAGSHNPKCQLWLFVEFKSFASSPILNPCPRHLQAAHSARNSAGGGAYTCFMWEPEVTQAYIQMMEAAAARYDANPRVEGFIFQESALGFSGEYSQDVGHGGTYKATAWRDALIELVTTCGEAFRQSRCMAFMNFIRGGQQYLHDVSEALAQVPDNRGCFSGPDVLPDNATLYGSDSSVYQVLVRHQGCRSNSAQNDSYQVAGCGLDCIFQFAVGGKFGAFPADAPRTAGLCVNSYLMWNHRVSRSATGLDWTDALPVIAAYPYGPAWHEQCAGGGDSP